MKIITTGTLGQAFQKEASQLGFDLTIKYVEKVTQADIEWADCLASSSITKRVNISKIKWIHAFSAGIDGFLEREDLHKDLTITRTIGQMGRKMGEFCLTHILNFTQHTFKVYENQKSKLWCPIDPLSISSMKVMILGTGEMGKGVATVLSHFNIDIIGVNSDGHDVPEFDKCMAFDDVFTGELEINCIINTFPLTLKTRGIIDIKFLELFKNALFINVGRGQSLNTKDLEQSIRHNNIKFAVLDVFEKEPLSSDASLWDHPDIFVSPHQAAVTDIDDVMENFPEAYERIIRCR